MYIYIHIYIYTGREGHIMQVLSVHANYIRSCIHTYEGGPCISACAYMYIYIYAHTHKYMQVVKGTLCNVLSVDANLVVIDIGAVNGVCMYVCMHVCMYSCVCS